VSGHEVMIRGSCPRCSRGRGATAGEP
jgi:hypothetical protein